MDTGLPVKFIILSFLRVLVTLGISFTTTFFIDLEEENQSLRFKPFMNLMTFKSHIKI